MSLGAAIRQPPWAGGEGDAAGACSGATQTEAEARQKRWRGRIVQSSRRPMAIRMRIVMSCLYPIAVQLSCPANQSGATGLTWSCNVSRGRWANEWKKLGGVRRVQHVIGQCGDPRVSVTLGAAIRQPPWARGEGDAAGACSGAQDFPGPLGHGDARGSPPRLGRFDPACDKGQHCSRRRFCPACDKGQRAW